ncbi:hypothetical protein DYBT9275_04885 [Dyadobacter sp. CECT 9275]|uniref:Uncharacterized protein n=1 Tax=Dyadobacter helix TaxID=2822344 RepID=A0A916JJK1_9BACT|nr:hypothetical protein [Dyadobacter sp. CECT 9275]CAG5011121.1 hypothetical protein DYBT9275_04885 [Dyadobacter sp. CECT 9275]
MKDHENKEDLEHSFPEGFDYFKNMADETARQSRLIDERIKNIPTEDIRQTSHRLEFNPAGLTKAREAWVNREDRRSLEGLKTELEADLTKRMEQGIKSWDLDKDTATQIRDATRETLHPNPFKGKTKEQLDQIKGKEKDLQNSQDFMRTLLDNERKGTNSPAKTGKGREPGME